jgi:hypothetical protein
MGVPLTHCRQGHELTDDNVDVYTRRDGKVIRSCRTCNRLRRKRQTAKRHNRYAYPTETYHIP